MALEQLVLRTKALQLQAHGSDLAADVCAELPEPPAAEAVSGAVDPSPSPSPSFSPSPSPSPNPSPNPDLLTPNPYP